MGGTKMDAEAAVKHGIHFSRRLLQSNVNPIKKERHPMLACRS